MNGPCVSGAAATAAPRSERPPLPHALPSACTDTQGAQPAGPRRQWPATSQAPWTPASH